MMLNLHTIRQVIEDKRPALLIIAKRDEIAWMAALSGSLDAVVNVTHFCGVPVVVANTRRTAVVAYNLDTVEVF